MIHQVEVPTYPSIDKEGEPVIVTEFAGKLVMTYKGEKIRVYFTDIKRAWEAVRKF